MITISLCMIVRNEEAVLARCLNSIQDVADEIIIIDTGSDDNTKEIAQHYTPFVYDFSWCDDFAAARNFSFSKATMDYCMWMDADDILPPIEKTKLLNQKQQMTCDTAPDIIMLKYATAFDSKNNPTFSFYRERLLRRECSFLWKGRVHETIALSGKIEYLDIYFAHYSQKKVYGDRNLKIYERMKAECEHFSPRDRFYYARELYYHNQYSNAIENFLQFLTCPDAFVENQVDACRFAAYCCYPLNEPKRALQFLLRGLSYRTPSGELCCDLGKHFMDRSDYTQAIFWYLAALHAPKETQNGGFISEECYDYLPCLQLSICYDRLGQTQKALQYHKLAGTYQPDGIYYLRNQPYFLMKEKELVYETHSNFMHTLN